MSADPILKAIADYRAGMADFNLNAPEDNEEANAYTEQSYGPPMRVLEAWDSPATTGTGAFEALRLVIEDLEINERSNFVLPMVKAVAGFLEHTPNPHTEVFRLTSSMEEPLTIINDLATALALIAETLDDDGHVVQRLAWLIRDHVRETEATRSNLFRLSHANRAHFEKVGWPS